MATTPATPAAPVPAATPRKPVTARPHVLRSVRVSRRTRRLHLGSVSCLRTSGTCPVSVSVKVGDVRIARITGTVKAGASKRLTVRLSRSALKRLIAGTGVATTTITSAGSDPIVRTTKVAAKRR